MNTSLFSQSLMAVDLKRAVELTAATGYDAIEIGCFGPHLTLDRYESRIDEVRSWLQEAGLAVSALSLSVSYTSQVDAEWRDNVDQTCRFIRLCRAFDTRIVKMMPGRPGSAEATESHWDRFRQAMDEIVAVAREEEVRLALETHLRHLSDAIEATARCLDCGDPDVLGVNLDFCNVRTCGGDPADAIDRFRDRIVLTHVKDSLFTTDSGKYVPLGEGKMDYGPVMAGLDAAGYDGYLSVECLYQDPEAWIAHDLRVLRGWLSQ